MDKIAELKKYYVEELPFLALNMNPREVVGYLLSELESVQMERDYFKREAEHIRNERDMNLMKYYRMSDENQRLQQERNKAIEALKWYADGAEEEARRFHFGIGQSGIGLIARSTLKELWVSTEHSDE